MFGIFVCLWHGVSLALFCSGSIRVGALYVERIDKYFADVWMTMMLSEHRMMATSLSASCISNNNNNKTLPFSYLWPFAILLCFANFSYYFYSSSASLSPSTEDLSLLQPLLLLLILHRLLLPPSDWGAALFFLFSRHISSLLLKIFSALYRLCA